MPSQYLPLKSALFPGGCPECGGGHTMHEQNVLGHATNCSLKPENIIEQLEDELVEKENELLELGEYVE